MKSCHRYVYHVSASLQSYATGCLSLCWLACWTSSFAIVNQLVNSVSKFRLAPPACSEMGSVWLCTADTHAVPAFVSLVLQLYQRVQLRVQLAAETALAFNMDCVLTVLIQLHVLLLLLLS